MWTVRLHADPPHDVALFRREVRPGNCVGFLCPSGNDLSIGPYSAIGMGQLIEKNEKNARNHGLTAVKANPARGDWPYPDESDCPAR